MLDGLHLSPILHSVPLPGVPTLTKELCRITGPALTTIEADPCLQAGLCGLS